MMFWTYIKEWHHFPYMMVRLAACGLIFGMEEPITLFLGIVLFCKKKGKTICSQNVRAVDSITQIFHLPLSGKAYDQLQLLLEAIELLMISYEPDVWS